MDLRGGRKPIPHADGRLRFRVSRLQHIQDDAGLTVVAKAWKRLPGLRIERKQERASRDVDHTVRVADPSIAEDVALLSSTAEEAGHVVGPHVVTVGRVDRIDASRESVTHITPSTTTGVVWLLTPSMTPCWKSHPGTSAATFDVLI